MLVNESGAAFDLDTNILIISDLQDRKLYVGMGLNCEHELVEYTS